MLKRDWAPAVPKLGRPSWLFAITILLGSLVDERSSADASASESCTKTAIRWEYPVPLTLSGLKPGEDWSGAQVRVFDELRNEVVSRALGKDLDIEDDVWTPLWALVLPWGSYTLEADLEGALSFQHNFSVPRDKSMITGEFQVASDAVARRRLAATGQRQHEAVVSGARALLADQYLGWQRGAGRKLLGEHGCGMGCICADMCCAAPPQCRQVGETCREERSMFSREVILTCADGACNVTVDGVEACRNHLCLADTCSQTLGCSFLNPHACSDCASCAYAGLGIWCAESVMNSGICKAPGDSVCPRSLSHALSPRARVPPPPAVRFPFNVPVNVGRSVLLTLRRLAIHLASAARVVRARVARYLRSCRFLIAHLGDAPTPQKLRRRSQRGAMTC